VSLLSIWTKDANAGERREDGKRREKGKADEQPNEKERVLRRWGGGEREKKVLRR